MQLSKVLVGLGRSTAGINKEVFRSRPASGSKISGIVAAYKYSTYTKAIM